MGPASVRESHSYCNHLHQARYSHPEQVQLLKRNGGGHCLHYHMTRPGQQKERLHDDMMTGDYMRIQQIPLGSADSPLLLAANCQNRRL